jgi:hypothetical protein
MSVTGNHRTVTERRVASWDLWQHIYCTVIVRLLLCILTFVNKVRTSPTCFDVILLSVELTPWSGVLLEKLIVAQQVNKYNGSVHAVVFCIFNLILRSF